MNEKTKPRFDPEGPVSWEALSLAEPKLTSLETLLRAVRDDGSGAAFCSAGVWYGGAKAWLVSLVGWSRGELMAAVDPNDGGVRMLTADEFPGIEMSSKSQPTTSPWEGLLRSTQAYDVAYDHLISLLPPCRNCWC